jgi:hypothetical protein
MSWVWAVVAVWLLLAVLVGVLIGRGVRLADRKQAETTAAEAAAPNFVVDPPARAEQPPAIPVQASERRIQRTPSPRRPDRA